MALRKQYRTAKGLAFDMEAFTQANEKVVAVGNLGGPNVVNAKGDILGKAGKVIKKRKEVVDQYYRENLPVHETRSIKEEIAKKRQEALIAPTTVDVKDEEFLSPEAALAKVEETKKETFVEPKPKRRPRKTST